MSDSSAIRLLQTAIEMVRDQCTGSEYKDLLAACDACDKAAEASEGREPKGGDSDSDDQPKTLKAASETVRKRLGGRGLNSGTPDKPDTVPAKT